MRSAGLHALTLALGAALVASPASGQQDPLADTPPPPGRTLPAPAAGGDLPEAPAPRNADAGAGDCATRTGPERSTCLERALAGARSLHQSEVARCEATLSDFLREQLHDAESAWQTEQNNNCMWDDDETRCLLETTRRRNDELADHCGFGESEQDEEPGSAREGPLAAGPQTGMLPARWTPARGEPREVPFSFENRGRNAVRGTMHTALDGERFEGEYLRVEESTQGKLVTAMSISWSGPEWELWQRDADGKWVEEGMSVGEFAHFYTGRVLASLRGDRGHAMRCQIALKDPAGGLLRGGSGRCQVTDGGSLALEF